MPTWSEPRAPLAGDERLAWLALARTRGVGPARMATLLEACETAIGALSAPIAFLETLPGLRPETARDIGSASLADAEREIQRLEELGGLLLLPGDPCWPDLLLPLDDSPLCLAATGNLALLEQPAVAIVGSRDHSRYGKEVCESVAGRAASAGLVVVSGMARGLDAVAHEAALAAGGGTIGVLGNGLGVIYPVANRLLYRNMRERGLLLTEMPPGARPTEGSFPRRNRIIAALARVTVVIEAAANSGALITASVANDLSRHVMAVPGPITSPGAVGTNRLIQDGAHPLLTIDDLLCRYPEAAGRDATPAAVAPVAGEEARALLRLLARGPAHVDELCTALGATAPAVLSALGSLEVAGLVRHEPGMRYVRQADGLAAETMPAPHRPT